MLSDVFVAARALTRRPSLTLAALATFTLGIGAATAMYAVIDGVLLRPLPFPASDRIVKIWEAHPGAPVTFQRHWLSNLTLDAWAPRATTVAAFGRYSTGEDTVGDERPERITSTAVSAALFDVLGASPQLGRSVEPLDEREGAAPVVVLSHAFWAERFGGSPSALGQSLTINGESHQIVGVMPEDFAFPAPSTRFWRADIVPAAGDGSRVRVLSVIGRLADGATADAAAQEGTSVARAHERPPAATLLFGTGGPVEVLVQPLVAEMTATVRPAMFVAAAGVAVVLLLASANVAHLLLARGVSRQREFAVRAALGAGRRRLAREAMTEGLLLATTGSLMGWLVARALVAGLPALAPRGFPRMESVVLDWRVLAVAVLLSLGSGLIAGLVPAWRASRIGATTLSDGGRGATAAAARRLRRGLLVAETALAALLLVSALLLARSFVRLINVDPGFVASGVLTADIVFPRAMPAGAPSVSRVHEMLDAIRRLPGVTAAGASNMAPMTPSTAIQMIPLAETGPDGQPLMARALAWSVTPGFMEALGLGLRDGRFLQPSDVGASSQAFMVNEAFVRQYWGRERSLVGRRYPGLLHSKGTVAELVGIVGDVLKDGLDRAPEPGVFVAAGTAERYFSGRVVLAVRTAGPPGELAPAIRTIVHSVDAGLAVDRLSTLESRVAESVSTPRFGAVLVAAFAGLALLLAAIGLYGVLSHGVSERRREIGVRAALGASSARLVRMVVAEGLVLVGLGLVVGLGAAVWLTELMEAALFGISALDPWAYAAAPVVLLAVGLVSCALPARRAARVDPVEALRCE